MGEKNDYFGHVPKLENLIDFRFLHVCIFVFKVYKMFCSKLENGIKDKSGRR